MNETVTVTDDLINAARSPAGGWTRATLALFGVPWPPPKGWRKRLLGTPLPREVADRLTGGTAPPAEAPIPAGIPRRGSESNLERLYRENEEMAGDVPGR